MDTEAQDCLPAARNPSHMTVYSGAEEFLYFGADTDNGRGHELYRFDGSNLQMSADIRPGPSSSGLRGMFVLNGQLWFAATDGVNSNKFRILTHRTCITDIDLCVNNPNKIHPGACGCDVSDDDSGRWLA